MAVHIARLLLAGLLVAIPHVVAAQPSAEQKRLEALVGTWRIEVTLEATPLSPGTKASGTEECEWFANRHVVCRSEAKGSAGSYSQMRVLSYVPAQKQYVAYTIDSLGTALIAHGQVAGDTWTFTTNQPAFNIRLTLKTSAAGYTAIAELGGLDGKYQPLSVVRATRGK